MLRVAALALLFLLSMLPTAGASHPDSISEPVADGCTRDPGGLLAGTAPEWVYVHRDPRPVYARGTVVESHPAGADLFRSHDGYDADTTLALDPAYADLAATANLGEENGSLAVEWEERVLPTWAWPAPNDTLEVMGSWIWDCGHWGQGVTDPGYFVPGTLPGEPHVTGEETEIHPPRMVVVHHDDASTALDGAAVADVVISSEGTKARAVAESALGDCTPPSQDLCSTWTPVNDRDYAFDIAAPPSPAGATRIVWNVSDRGSVNAPAPVVTLNGSGIHVVVPFKGWGHEGDTMRFAKRFSVGWDAPRPTTHVRVTLERVTWLSELDGPQSSLMCPPELPCTPNPQFSAPPDEVVLYVEVAGQWQRIDAPALLAAHPGDVVPLHTTFDAYLAPRAPLTLSAVGRECDMPHLVECPVPTEQGFNDGAGNFALRFDDVAAAQSEHAADGTSSDCTTSTHGPCYHLVYRVEVLGAAHPPAIPRAAWLVPFGGLLVAGVVLVARRR